jgi:hypothetical protein
MIMKKYLLITTIILLSLSLFNSCYYDKEDYLYPVRNNYPDGNCDTINVTYKLTIKPIIDNNCISCHGSGSAFNFEDYDPFNLYLQSNSQKLIANINYTSSQPMPPSGKLNDCYIKQIEIWIQAGHPNN